MIYVAVTTNTNFISCIKNNIYAERSDIRMKKIQPGDILVFYILKKSCFSAIAKVKSKVKYDSTLIFTDELFPYRISLDFIYKLKEENWIKLKDISDKLEVIKNKSIAPGVYFRTNMKEILEKDYKIIEYFIKKEFKMLLK